MTLTLAEATLSLRRHLFGSASKRLGYVAASTHYIYLVVHDELDCPETWEGYLVVVERRGN